MRFTRRKHLKYLTIILILLSHALVKLILGDKPLVKRKNADGLLVKRKLRDKLPGNTVVLGGREQVTLETKYVPMISCVLVAVLRE